MDIRKKSRKQEERVAKELRGRPTPASGALWGAKGDVRNDKFLVECKFTDNSYYTLNSKTWKKIFEEAMHDNFRIPVMCIDVSGRGYAVLSFGDFQSLCGNDEMILSIKDVHKQSFRITSSELDEFSGAIRVLCDYWSYGDLVIMRWGRFKKYADLYLREENNNG